MKLLDSSSWHNQPEQAKQHFLSAQEFPADSPEFIDCMRFAMHQLDISKPGGVYLFLQIQDTILSTEVREYAD